MPMPDALTAALQRAAAREAESRILQPLLDRIDELRAALKPFTDFDCEDFPDTMRLFDEVPSPTIGDIRKAKIILNKNVFTGCYIEGSDETP